MIIYTLYNTKWKTCLSVRNYRRRNYCGLYHVVGRRFAILKLHVMMCVRWWTIRQIDRRQTDRRIDRQTDKQTDGRKDYVWYMYDGFE